jgi:hypothetical protein
MHATLFTISACLAVAAMGCGSAALVWVACLWFRCAGTRRELMFGYAAIIGIGLLLVGKGFNIPVLSAGSVLLWGWLVLPVVLIPPVVAWQGLAWVLHRFTLQPRQLTMRRDRPNECR